MNILITGATGFLGTALSNVLVSKGHTITPLGSRDADLTVNGSLSKYSSQKYDVVIHLAAWTQAGDFCLYHPGEQWIINQKMNTNVLSWCQEHQKDALLVTMGTSCSYDPELPLIEENYLVGTPIESLFTYAHTKRMMQIGLQSLHKQFGLSYLTVVPSTLYGPDYHTDGRQMHFIFDLIRKIISGKYKQTDVILWGDGYQKRELVYVYDFAEILIQLIEKGVKNEILNIGAGSEFTIREFAQTICEKVGYPVENIQYDTSKYVGAKSKFLSVKKLGEILPSYQLTPLQLGLNKTIDWFLQEKDKLIA